MLLNSLKRNSHHLLGSRESSLIIFHGLGKVLYNKRMSIRIVESCEACTDLRSSYLGWGDDPAQDAKDKRFRPPKPDRVPQFLEEFDRRQIKTDVDVRLSSLIFCISITLGFNLE